MGGVSGLGGTVWGSPPSAFGISPRFAGERGSEGEGIGWGGRAEICALEAAGLGEGLTGGGGDVFDGSAELGGDSDGVDAEGEGVGEFFGGMLPGFFDDELEGFEADSVEGGELFRWVDGPEALD